MRTAAPHSARTSKTATACAAIAAGMGCNKPLKVYTRPRGRERERKGDAGGSEWHSPRGVPPARARVVGAPPRHTLAILRILDRVCVQSDQVYRRDAPGHLGFTLSHLRYATPAGLGFGLHFWKAARFHVWLGRRSDSGRIWSAARGLEAAGGGRHSARARQARTHACTHKRRP